MASQVVVVNNSHHSIKVIGHDFVKKCHKKSDYSCRLPFSAHHHKEYKIEVEEHIIAYVQMDHHGMIRFVKNVSEKFCVYVKNNFHAHSRQIRSFAQYGLDVGDWQEGYLNALILAGEPQLLIVNQVKMD